MSSHAFDIINPAIKKTKVFFSGPGLKEKWIKIGILVFVFSLLSGGGGGGSSGGNFSSPEETIAFSEVGSVIENAIRSISPETWLLIYTIIIVGFIVLFLLSIILIQIKNITFFSILESIETNNVMILPYWRKFWGKSISLTFLEVILGLLMLPLVLGLFILIIGSLILIFGIDTSLLGPLAPLASLPVLIFIGIFTLIGMIIFGIIRFVLTQFAIYWMYISDMGAFEALKKSFSLIFQNLTQVIILIIAKIILGIAIAIISLAAMLIVLIPSAMIGIIVLIALTPLIAISAPLVIFSIITLIFVIIVFVIIMSILLAPLTVFVFYYDLMFLKKLLGEKPAKTETKSTVAPTKKPLKFQYG